MIQTILYLWLAISVCTANDLKTVLCIKESYTWSTTPITTGAGTFHDFVAGSSIFIDKSVLIKEILEDPHKLLCITRPPLWGKTLNLDMIRTFLQMSIPDQGNKTYSSISTPSNRIFVGDEVTTRANEVMRLSSHTNDTLNYRLFVKGELSTPEGKIAKLRSPLLIAKYRDIVEKYLGKGAVIYLNLSHIRGNDMNTLMDNFRRRMSDAYKQHDYLIAIFNRIAAKEGNKNIYGKIAAQKRLQMFMDVVSNEHRLNGGEVDDGVKILAEMLHVYLEIPVYILIDDYDAPLRALFYSSENSEEEKQDFLNFYTDFIRITLQTNTFYDKAIISGVCPLAEEHYKTLSDIIKEYTFYDGHLMEFYGMERNETNSIFQYLNLPGERLAIANGFFNRPRYQFANSTAIVNNPWSVATFLAISKKKTGMNLKWLENFITFFMLIDHKRFQNHFNRIFTEFGEQVKLQYFEGQHLSLEELEILHKAMFFPNQTDKFKPQIMKLGLDKFTHRAIMFLHTNGFLTVYKSMSKLTADGLIRVKFPMREEFLTMLEVIRKSLGIVLNSLMEHMTTPNLGRHKW